MLDKFDMREVSVPHQPLYPPEGICIVCAMRYGKYITEDNCKRHTATQRELYRLRVSGQLPDWEVTY